MSTLKQPQQLVSNGNQKTPSTFGKQGQKVMESKRKSKQEADGEDGEEENNDEEWFSDSSSSSQQDIQAIEKEPRLVMYAAFTQYDVVKETGKCGFNYHLTKNEQRDWDIAWFDGAISIKLLQKMWPHQRTNHFPGMYNLARKNCLGRHLMRMQKWFQDDYDFFPQTYMLPTDYKEFKAQITAKRNKTFIVKPEASCQGKGIFLTRNFEDIEPSEHYVVQRYMHKPYLIDGYKFDLRLYVMLCGVNPLRIFIYKEGLARFATVPYESPTPANLENLFMHLTNYAINKESADFVQNTNENADDVGSKRSFTSVLKRIAQVFGEDRSKLVFDQIKDIIIKTMCIAQPYLQHLYRSSQPDDMENQMCFQILGFDVMLDHNLKPQLLEVNQSPSFTTDSPLDYKIKKALITDTIKILNLSIKRKLKVKGDKRAEMQKRLFKTNQIDKGKEMSENKQKEGRVSIKISPRGQENEKQKQKQQQADTKEQIRRKRMLQREKYENELKGDYELIYPIVSYEQEFKLQEENKNKEIDSGKIDKPQDAIEEKEEDKEEVRKLNPWEQQQQYMEYMEKAKELWESFTQGTAVQRKKKEQEQKEKEEQQKKKEQQQKARLLQKMRQQQEERRLEMEKRKKEQVVSYRQQQMSGLDENGNYMSGGDLLKQYRNTSAGMQSSRNERVFSQDASTQGSRPQGFSSPQVSSNQSSKDSSGAYVKLELFKQEFFLPQVESSKSGIASHLYQNVKKQLQESYDQKYAQILKHYQVDSLPAVPALNQYSQDQQMKKKMPKDYILKSDHNNIQKPPLNKSSMYQKSDQDDLIQQQKLPPKRQNVTILNTQQKLHELLNLGSNSQYMNQVNSFQNHNQINRSGHHKVVPNNNNEPYLYGAGHYNSLGSDLARSMSMDKKELPKIQVSKQNQNNQSIQNQAPQSNGRKVSSKANSEFLTDIVNLGVVGERKQLMTHDLRSLENQQQLQIQQVSMKIISSNQKKQRVLQIKDKSQQPISSNRIQSIISPLQHSSSHSNTMMFQQQQQYSNDIYRFMH